MPYQSHVSLSERVLAVLRLAQRSLLGERLKHVLHRSVEVQGVVSPEKLVVLHLRLWLVPRMDLDLLEQLAHEILAHRLLHIQLRAAGEENAVFGVADGPLGSL